MCRKDSFKNIKMRVTPVLTVTTNRRLTVSKLHKAYKSIIKRGRKREKEFKTVPFVTKPESILKIKI